MRASTSTLVSMNMAGLSSLLVEIFSSETQAFGPDSRGMNGPRFVQVKPQGGLRCIRGNSNVSATTSTSAVSQPATFQARDCL